MMIANRLIIIIFAKIVKTALAVLYVVYLARLDMTLSVITVL